MEEDSIIKKFYTKFDFIDKKVLRNDPGIDVIVPILNTNEVFEANLYSWYKEIPINRLLIGNAGITDNSIEILNKFPRVVIFDQSDNKTLGYSIAELISKVETEWFIYLHADVYLPENWYENMQKYQNQYDWYESDRCNVIIVAYPQPYLKYSKRAYSGSQMGRKKAFKNIIPLIEDDYLYRNEDIIFHELIKAKGYKYGRVFDTFHYHQTMNKKGEKEPKFQYIHIQRASDPKWETMVFNMQVKGIIKYCNPKKYLIKAVNESIATLKKQGQINLDELKLWIKATNKIWLKYIDHRKLKDPEIFIKFIKRFLKKLTSILSKFV